VERSTPLKRAQRALPSSREGEFRPRDVGLKVGRREAAEVLVVDSTDGAAKRARPCSFSRPEKVRKSATLLLMRPAIHSAVPRRPSAEPHRRH
jgi:hypothetical protein